MVQLVPLSMIDGDLSSSVATIAAMKLLDEPASGKTVALTCGVSEGDGRGGLWEWRPTSTATEDDALVIKITAVTTGRWHRIVGPIYDARWWGITTGASGAAAANSTAINAAIVAIGTAGGGILMLPQGVIYVSSTLDNKYSRVLVAGAGGEYFHDAAHTYGTTIRATGAITVLKHRSEYGVSNSKNSGGGWVDMIVEGDSLATKLLEVDSINGGSYDLLLKSCAGTYAAEFKCGVTSTDLGEACDIQGMVRCRLRIRQIDTVAAQACGGVKFTGSSNANVSLNDNIEIDVQHYGGHGVDVVSADNCVFKRIRTYSAGGAGKGIVFRGPTIANPVGGEHNVILHYSSNTTGEAEGTGTAGVTAGIKNTILYHDAANSTPSPSAGTGSAWLMHKSNHITTNLALAAAVAGVGETAAALAQAARLSTDGFRVYSASDSHLMLQSAAGVWAIRVIEASGNLDITRISGAGGLNLPSLATVWTIGGSAVSYGANDSAGAGFKYLRAVNAAP